MSLRTSDPEKPKKKSKKLKRRKGTKRTGTGSAVTEQASTNYSQDVDPPSTIFTSLNSAIIKWNQEEARDIDPYEDGDYTKMPHEAPNEVNFVGGIGPNTGHRRSKKFIDRTTQIQQIYNMRCDNKTIFNVCEDPRLTSNIPARRETIDVENSEVIAKNTVHRIAAIKHEQIRKETTSDPFTSTEQIPGQISSLDASVEDDQFTENKQASLQIRKQHLDQKRTLLKQKLEVEVPQRLGSECRKEKFKLSEYFDIEEDRDEVDMESIVQVEVDWTEKYKVDPHLCDLKFGRPIPFIPTLPQAEKLAFLTRTLDKPKNVEKLNLEAQNYSKPIEEAVKKDFPYRETARKLKKLLQKQKSKNFPIELALKEFDKFMENANVFNTVVDDHDPQEISNDEPCRQNLQAAMKDYEEKILNHLLEIDGPSFEMIRSDEDPEVSLNDEDKRTDVSLQEHTSPKDFTYPFEVKRTAKDSDVKQGNEKDLTLEQLIDFSRYFGYYSVQMFIELKSYQCFY